MALGGKAMDFFTSETFFNLYSIHPTGQCRLICAHFIGIWKYKPPLNQMGNIL